MSERRVELIKSSAKKSKELDETVDTILEYQKKIEADFELEHGKSMLEFNPNDDVDRKRASAFFSKKTNTLKNEIKTLISLGYSEEEALNRVLPKAYATVKAASKFLWTNDREHPFELYNVQLKGGILLHEGYASQMATGEGKTKTASLPAYLNALLGKGSHVITPNGYLAMRDQKEMSELYEFMGLSCGLVEERSPITREDIEKKAIEILDVRLKKYTEGAKTEEERQALVKSFMSDRKNSKEVEAARAKAREALQKEELLRRKKAYEADITYGSASAIAFDYLYDDIATEVDNMVQRPGLPNFAVVDEVDAVLFDDAVTPFSLSGTETDEELALKEEERKEAEKNINLANMAIYKIITEDRTLRQRNAKDHLTAILDEASFEAIVNGKAEEQQIEKYDMVQAVLIEKNTKQYHLTTLGETIVFQYYYMKDINRILLEKKNEILKMEINGEPLFTEGIDYTINNNGRILMESRAFAYLVTSGLIPELTDKFEEFGLNELIKHQPEIDNALRAWFILEEDVDYKLSVPSDSKNPKERSVSLVMNGRTAEGRVYSNGLQQALEAKEKHLKRGEFEIRLTKMKNTLASIPTASFFARYKNVGGMTGTAAVSAFKELYGLETYEVPRNKEKAVIDRGDRFYATIEEKNEKIFEEVFKSYIKKQPVLLSTTSIEESEALFRYLDRRFKEKGYSVNIPVLNARVDKLEEEAKIISRAGLPGAITISTEMAGRGTDIKLGGEIPDISELISVVAEERVASTMEIMRKKGQVNSQNESQIEKQIRKKVFQDKENLEIKAKERREILAKRQKEMKTQVLDAGGLKVVGSGHFPYSRVDDQVKGRCGRQGDKGEVIFFNDTNDLLKVGVSKKQVDELIEKSKTGEIKEDPRKGYTPIGDLVYEAQSKTEEMVKTSIKYSQEIEREVAAFRKDFRIQRDGLKRSGDYLDAMDFMIEETVKSIILGTSKKDSFTLNDKTRLSTAGLDLEELASLSSEFLGVDIGVDEIKRFKTIGELRKHITDMSFDRFDSRIEQEGEEKTNAKTKEVVDKLLNRTWHDFEGYVECIKNQRMLNNLVQVSTEGLLPAQISMAYAHCAESQRAMMVREIINPGYRDKYGKDARSELVPVRVTPHGVERVDRDFDKKQEESIRQTEEESKEEVTSMSSIKNLQPRSRMFTFVNKSTLNKIPARLRDVQSNPVVPDDEIESVDFSEAPIGKKR